MLQTIERPPLSRHLTDAELIKVEACALRHSHRAVAVMSEDELAAIQERVGSYLRANRADILRAARADIIIPQSEDSDPYFGGQEPRW